MDVNITTKEYLQRERATCRTATRRGLSSGSVPCRSNPLLLHNLDPLPSITQCPTLILSGLVFLDYHLCYPRSTEMNKNSFHLHCYTPVVAWVDDRIDSPLNLLDLEDYLANDKHPLELNPVVIHFLRALYYVVAYFVTTVWLS